MCTRASLVLPVSHEHHTHGPPDMCDHFQHDRPGYQTCHPMSMSSALCSKRASPPKHSTSQNRRRLGKGDVLAESRRRPDQEDVYMFSSLLNARIFVGWTC